MLQLPRMTDYGVVVMAQLAREGAALQTAPGIAARTGLSAATVSKLLKQLAAARLVTSQRGATGGYSLSVAPEAVTIGAIIEALDGAPKVAACVDGVVGACEVERTCPVRGRWDPVQAAIQSALRTVTLADMLGDAGCAGLESWAAVAVSPARTTREREAEDAGAPAPRS